MHGRMVILEKETYLEMVEDFVIKKKVNLFAFICFTMFSHYYRDTFFASTFPSNNETAPKSDYLVVFAQVPVNFVK